MRSGQSSWQKGESKLKVSIELTEEGELTIDTGEDELDAVAVNALLDVAKLNLVTSFMRDVVEGKATPEETDEISV